MLMQMLMLMRMLMRMRVCQADAKSERMPCSTAAQPVKTVLRGSRACPWVRSCRFGPQQEPIMICVRFIALNAPQT